MFATAVSPKAVPVPTARSLAVFAPLLGAGVCLAAAGCLPRGGAIADAAAVERVAALDGTPLPPADWTTDPAAARVTAAAEGKDVLMLFTGSDWCRYCVLLDEQVFSRAPASRLTDDFVPVLVDFPQSPLPPALAAQNDALQAEYGVEGFPTVVLTDPAGAEYGRIMYDASYESGGAAAFVADVRALRSAAGPGDAAGPRTAADPAAGAASL